jgi:hypothetical protein
MGGRVSNVTSWGWADCALQLCENGEFELAAPGTCKERVNYGIVHMSAGDCRNLGGAMNGNPADQTWTSCHLDICRDGEFVFDHAQVKAQVAYGFVNTPYDGCAYLGGGMNPNFDVTKDCFLGITTVKQATTDIGASAQELSTCQDKLATAEASLAQYENLPTSTTQTCPPLSEYNSVANRCISTVHGVCSMETAYQPHNGTIDWYYLQGETPAVNEYGRRVSGAIGGHCQTEDGADCGTTLRKACDTVRTAQYSNWTGSEAAEDMCFEVERWPHTKRGVYKPGQDYTPFFEACKVLQSHGMRVVQRHGI